MTLSGKLFTGLLFCALVAWFAGSTGRFLVAVCFLLFVPGYLLERNLPRSLPCPLFTRPALWLALSLSTIALLYQWVTALGLALTPTVLNTASLVCGVGLLWSTLFGNHEDTRTIWSDPEQRNELLAWGGLLLVLMLTFWTRFTQIQDQVLPVWVDSVHHALLVRVAAEQGQVPYSLAPYLPIEHLPYHWGYHVVTAAVMQLSGMDLPRTMLWEGQIFNGLHVLTGAALAAYLWRRPGAGVVAGIVIGLVSIWPAYYVSWGRYTQLTGLLLVPPLAIAWHTWLYTASRRWFICVALLLAGLSMIHFRVLIMALCLLLILTAEWSLHQPGRLLMMRLGQAALLSLCAIGLAAPWMWVLTITRLDAVASDPTGLVSGGSYVDMTEGLLWAGQNRLLVALALVAAFWGVVRRRRPALVMTGWSGGLIVLANPWLVGYLLPAAGALLTFWGVSQCRYLLLTGGVILMLPNAAFISIPYTWLITNDIVAISLFLPLGILIGGGVCLLLNDLRQRLSTRWYDIAFYGALAAIAASAVWGTWTLRTVINSETIFVSQADVDALDWIAEYAADDARFLINATSWFPTVDRGVDGGYWLLPLTGHWTTTPPSIYTYGPPHYVREVEERSKVVSQFEPGDEQALLSLIDEHGIDYIYLRDEVGPLTPAIFAGNDRFQAVYEQDSITILAVHPQS